MPILKNFIAFCSFLLFLLTETYAQEATSGPCKIFPELKDFDFQRYLGLWYELAAIARESEELQKCIQFYFWDTRNENFPITRLYVDKTDGRKYNYTREAMIDERTGEGTIYDNYTFTILDVDYDKYLVAYACEEIDDEHKEIVWLNTRERMPDIITVVKAMEVLVKNNINISMLKAVNQTGCPDNWEDSEEV